MNESARAGTADPLDSQHIEAALAGPRLRGPVHVHASVASTNTVLLDLARAGAPEGTIVVTDEQTAGRGRLGRAWASPRGMGLWFTVLLRPPAPRDGEAGSSSLAVVAGLAVAGALREMTGTRPELKWPNDVLLGGRKVCGILAEASATSSAPAHPPVALGIGLGIGVNLRQREEDFPPELRASATSLALATGGEPPARAALLAAILRALETRYGVWLDRGIAPLVAEWDAAAAWQGREVEVVSGRETRRGVQLGLAPNGGLRLRESDGSESVVVAGETRLVQARPRRSP